MPSSTPTRTRLPSIAVSLSRSARPQRHCCVGEASGGLVDVARKEKKDEEEQLLNPWEMSAAKGGIDYEKLVDQFGCQRLDDALVGRVSRLTGRPRHCLQAIRYSSSPGVQ